MKQLKRFSLVYALQVFGVIMIFGYPGCSSNIKEQKIETGKKGIVGKKHAALKVVSNKAQQVTPAILLIQKPEVANIHFASYLNFSK